MIEWDRTASAGGAARAFAKQNKLKLFLVAGDATAFLLGFFAALQLSSFGKFHGELRASAVAAVAAIAGVWAMRSQGLLLARVSAVRAVEITRTARAMAILAGVMLILDRIFRIDLHLRQTALACALSFVLVCASRSRFRSWLGHARERGEYRRSTAIIGTDEAAMQLIDLFNTHRDIGIAITGVIGDPEQAAANGLGNHWLCGVEHAETMVDLIGVSGVIVSPSGLQTNRLNELIRNLHAAGRHIHLTTGISGIDTRRLRPLPLAHEPLFYVEAPSLGKAQVVAKRCFDVVLASLALVLFSPVLLAVALAVKLGDGGPVLFKQTRIGRDGRPFAVLKFRSMAVDAEHQLAQLSDSNERQGPLFKIVKDPRVTRVGKFLRESSLDELPQLVNVLKGEMSLVGPRPALPTEVINFSAALRKRELVPPGITGLWQVEARDNPSFEAYRRLDLFYVENWSITLDLFIIVGTVEQIVWRLFRTILPRHQHERGAMIVDGVSTWSTERKPPDDRVA
jgi:exopolysaccharide biosynthesis polyprenyl glycosylphosphotransferase